MTKVLIITFCYIILPDACFPDTVPGCKMAPVARLLAMHPELNVKELRCVYEGET